MAGPGHLAAATARTALVAMAFLLGCTATEKIGTLPPGGPIPQLGLSPVTVNFVFSIGGAAPPSQVVSLSASPGQIDGLNIGTILYTPIS